MKTAYFDCFSGVSGDMILGALAHLGVPGDFIDDSIGQLLPGEFRLKVGASERMNIHGFRAEVIVKNKGKSRNYKQIRGLIGESKLSERVKTTSLKIFSRLAEVEAAIHGCAAEDVHFHELGGVDAIVDIVGASLGMEWLAIEKTVASEIPVGRGFIDCAHGRLPVPAPATVALLKGVPVYGTQVSSELVTPTGAAIVTSLAEDFGPMPGMQISEVGYGVGAAKLKEWPNLLRVVIGECETVSEKDQVQVVETNIDDMNPEIFGFVMERLFEDGALDVIWIPIFMKKNRPGTMIQVLCDKGRREKVIERILSETTATGVRHYSVERRKLLRRVKEATTNFGKVQVKEISGPMGRVVLPEYEDCKRIALKEKIPLKRVYELISREIAEQGLAQK
ncbi:MAG: nickel pincer cofactor biosynthesis protein LarC [Deltaproteobacteria bacterium]|nr:nickel pincer cofactor biosynthesis protein LarC [Deltaproteobacteria bacterium]MBW2317429.1 nickel pincer cofactor biosynthesis protein LarC [Deltaproteobacteria bacterium]MBW2600672.1 nickel pincer cofactor biosynthesis protein LarC [Deltaproteobacteria bacterium]